MDSDSIIPPDFIGKSLLYFQEDEKIGIVQSKSICNRQQNLFDYIGSYIHNVEQQADFTTRNIFGMQLFSGHNAIISKECFYSIGGLPQILGEDHGFSYQAFSKKFKIILANNIFSYETYPIEYFFFKKRQHRWTIGGAEVVRYIWWPFLKSNENIFKKTDLIIAQTEMFLTTFTTIVSIFNITILLPLNFIFNFSVWFIIMLTFLTLQPIINIFAFYLFKINFFKLILICLFAYFVYTSMSVWIIRGALRGLFFKNQKFWVTPKKKNKNFRPWQIVVLSRWELILSFFWLLYWAYYLFFIVIIFWVLLESFYFLSLE